MSDPKKFCCCWKLMGGGKFIGWFSIAISILFGFISTCAIATITNKSIEQQTKEDQEYAVTFAKVLLFLVFNFFVSSMLIKGIEKKNPSRMLAWLIFHGVYIVVLISHSINTIYRTFVYTTVMALLLLGFYIYFWITIYMLYETIMQENKSCIPTVVTPHIPKELRSVPSKFEKMAPSIPLPPIPMLQK